MPGYFLPIYDQTNAQQRDSTGAIIQTQGQTSLYPQPSTPTATVVPFAYPQQTLGTPIYQGQVVYAPEQYAAASAASQQYPLTYPMSYSYPYNGEFNFYFNFNSCF